MESVGSFMNMFCSRIQTNFSPKSRSPMQQPEQKTPLSRRCRCGGGGGLRCLARPAYSEGFAKYMHLPLIGFEGISPRNVSNS